MIAGRVNPRAPGSGFPRWPGGANIPHHHIRLNTTVGFYSGSKAGEEHDLILAVRSSFPFAGVRR